MAVALYARPGCSPVRIGYREGVNRAAPPNLPSAPFNLAASSRGEGLVFLDCAAPPPDDSPGRSIIARAPEAVIRSKAGSGTLRWSSTSEGGARVEEVSGDPFRILDGLLRGHPDWTAAGYWGYDLRFGLERLPSIAVDDLGLPDCWVGLYAPAQVAAIPCGKGASRGTPRRLENAAGVLPASSFERLEYLRAVRRVLEYVAAGDCYQVNLSQRFSAPYSGDPWELYQRLRRVSPAPFAAYLDCGDHQVLSSSPELFLRVREGCVETHPIKGTRPRGNDAAQDEAAAHELLASAKDRAELLMIVDLERNDLGRVCEYGTINVPRAGDGDWARLESYPNVHHLVATVRGRLRGEVTPLEALRASFPGGSITGAPKIRAMEIIEELEPVRRGVYTGAIGWVDGRGNAEWSIAIRTMVVKEGQVHFHAGGGIVADSDPEAEYAETLAKAEGMLRALHAS